MSRLPEKPKKPMASARKSLKASAKPLVSQQDGSDAPNVHVIRPGVRCDTEGRGHKTPKGRSPLELVVDASEGFIPLWMRDTTLRWRFRESSFAELVNPKSSQSAFEKLFGEALLEWGDAAPIKFSKSHDAWDFEVVMRSSDNCMSGGCVLASAFFPDAGRHQLVLYPRLFEQSREEQIETIIHEVGHIFGLRHFFALVSEKEWPAEIFGSHNKFSIMNYGNESQLTKEDKDDLKQLYQLAWSQQLTHINGTPIRFVRAFHESGAMTDRPFAIAAMRNPFNSGA